MLAEMEVEYPHMKETMLAAMGKVVLSRLLDTRYLDNAEESEAEADAETAAETEAAAASELFPILT